MVLINFISILDPSIQPISEELHHLFSGGNQLNTTCKLRDTLAVVTGEPKFNRGSQEDAQDFLITTLQLLEVELGNNLVGQSLLKKFWGKEAYIRKFTYPRYEF